MVEADTAEKPLPGSRWRPRKISRLPFGTAFEPATHSRWLIPSGGDNDAACPNADSDAASSQPQMSRMTTEASRLGFICVHLRHLRFKMYPHRHRAAALQPDVTTTRIELSPDQIHLVIRQRCLPISFNHAGEVFRILDAHGPVPFQNHIPSGESQHGEHGDLATQHLLQPLRHPLRVALRLRQGTPIVPRRPEQHSAVEDHLMGFPPILQSRFPLPSGFRFDHKSARRSDHDVIDVEFPPARLRRHVVEDMEPPRLKGANFSPTSRSPK